MVGTGVVLFFSDLEVVLGFTDLGVVRGLTDLSLKEEEEACVGVVLRRGLADLSPKIGISGIGVVEDFADGVEVRRVAALAKRARGISRSLDFSRGLRGELPRF